MRSYFILAIIMSFYIQSLGQTNPQLINFWDNSSLINPAAAHPKSLAEFSFANRKQWIGIEGAPETLYATASYCSNTFNSQIGLKIISDKIGYSDITDFSLAYSYMIRTDLTRIVFGLAGSYTNYGYDPTKIELYDQSDPYANSAYDLKSRYNADLGLEFANDKFRAGMSCNKIFSLFAQKNKPELNDNINYFYFLYRQQSNNLVNFGYGLALIQSGYTTQAELNLNSFIHIDEFSDSPIQLGVSYRTRKHIGVMGGIYITQDFKLLYTYEINQNTLGISSGGTHEFVIRYRIGRNKQWGFRNYWENQLYNY